MIVLLAVVVFVTLLIETLHAARNERAQLARGGVEPRGDVYRVMRVVYPLAFLAMLGEGFARGGPPSPSLAAAGVAVFAAGKGLKWWAMLSLGPAWTFRVIVAGNPFPELSQDEMQRRLLPVMQANRPRPRLTFTYAVPAEQPRPDYRLVLVFDAANGLCTTDAHARVAIGLDYLGAAPVRGTRYGGGAETLTVAVKVEQAGRPGQWQSQSQ